ncbi:hypothetical protein MUP77_08830 [Candidatus Bathyarchaeota archaeon]|nr:hypothetical protein [Candidatus Bathyarchaeota archaeon]
MNREKIQRLVDILQLMGTPGVDEISQKPEDISKFDKVLMLVERKFPAGWFTSQDIMVAYEDQYDEPIGLSTVSTYLARLIDRGLISRSGGVSARRYRLRRVDDSQKRTILHQGEDEERF